MAGEYLPDHKVIAFAKSVTMTPQQMKDPLHMFVDSNLAFNEKGDRYTLDGFGLTDPIETFDDFGDTGANEPLSKHRRIGTFVTYEDNRPIKGAREAAEQLVDPTNPVTKALRGGMMRRRTKTILSGILGPQTEVSADGSYSTVTLPAAQKVAYNYNKLTKGAADGDAAPTAVQGLTIPKLRRAKVILSNGEYEDEEDSVPNIAVTQEDLEFLFTSAEFSAERHVVNQIGRLRDGETEEALGFRFIKVKPSAFQRAGLAVPGETDRWYLPVWFKNGIKYKERPLNATKIWQREEKKFRWWAWYENQDSCVREYDAAVAQIDVLRNFS